MLPKEKPENKDTSANNNNSEKKDNKGGSKKDKKKSEEKSNTAQPKEKEEVVKKEQQKVQQAQVLQKEEQKAASTSTASKKEKKDKSDHSPVDPEPKRRNSVTNSSLCTSSSNSSSSGESDEMEHPDSKGTMTTGTTATDDTFEGVEEARAEEGDGSSPELDKFRRPIRTDTPVDELSRDVGFRSLTHDFPIGIEVGDNSQSATVDVATTGTKKKNNKKKNQKKKAEREKEGSTDKNMPPIKTITTATSNIGYSKRDTSKIVVPEPATTQKAKKMLFDAFDTPRNLMGSGGNGNSDKESKRRTEEMLRAPVPYVSVLHGNNNFTAPKSFSSVYGNSRERDILSHSAVRTQQRINESKLQASVGFGVAATGIYDRVIEITAPRHVDRNNAEMYSDLVGPKRENWRNQFQKTFLQENCKLGSLTVEHDALLHYAEKMQMRARTVHKNKYITELLQLVLAGKLKKVWRRIEAMSRVCRERQLAQDHKYSLLTMPRKDPFSMTECIVQQIVMLLTDEEENTNPIMYFVSYFGALEKPCFMDKHKKCQMAEFLLASLPWYSRQRCLNMATHHTKRRVIHYACISGQPCQLDILLKFGINPNHFDSTTQAPIDYLVTRNHTLMVKQLMWHGADLSLVHYQNNKTPYEMYSNDNVEVCSYLKDRLASLERCMTSWLKALVLGKWKIGEPATCLHACRVGSYGDIVEDIEQREKGGVFTSYGHERDVRLKVKDELFRRMNSTVTVSEQVVLFMLPVFFTPQDAVMPPENPHIVRTKMFTDDAVVRPTKLISDVKLKYVMGSVEMEQILQQAFLESHNGYLYGFRMNKSFSGHEKVNILFDVNARSMNKTEAHHMVLLIQAFVVSSVNAKPKSE